MGLKVWSKPRDNLKWAYDDKIGCKPFDIFLWRRVVLVESLLVIGKVNDLLLITNKLHENY